MRRKSSPNPIVRTDGSRPLAPARTSSALPTAAALALALAGLTGVACSMPMDDGVRPDPVMKVKSPVAAPSPSPAPPALNAIEPLSVDVDGEVSVVKPKPVTTPSVKPYIAGPKPTAKHVTAGKPAIVRPLDDI